MGDIEPSSITVDRSGDLPSWLNEDEADSILCAAVADALSTTSFRVTAVELSVALLTNEDMAALNGEYRGKHKPTNVLSFPSYERDALDTAVDQLAEMSMPLPLGDIVFAADLVAHEATNQGKQPVAHFRHLAVHGALHLLGYDHIDDSDANIMEAHEIAILARYGIDNPYQNGPIHD